MTDSAGFLNCGRRGSFSAASRVFGGGRFALGAAFFASGCTFGAFSGLAR